MLHIGSEETYFISKEVYDTEVGDGDFAYWKEVIKELNTVTRSKDCYYSLKTVSIEKISENSSKISGKPYGEIIIEERENNLREMLDYIYKKERINLKQQRRFELFYLYGLDSVEIAKIEGVRKQATIKSIKIAFNKISPYFKKLAKK